MTDAGPETANELEDLLRRLEESQQQLVEALKSADSARFEKETAEGESLKRALERTSDEPPEGRMSRLPGRGDVDPRIADIREQLIIEVSAR